VEAPLVPPARCLSRQAAYQARFVRPIQLYRRNYMLNLYKLYAIPRSLLSNRIIRHKKTHIIVMRSTSSL
jgi:hypothetical protein